MMRLSMKHMVRGALLGVAAAAAMTVSSIFKQGPVVATDAGDCGPSSIVTCGVKTVDEIIAKYNSDEIVRDTYNKFGIYDAQLAELKRQYDNGAQLGTVVPNFFGSDVVIDSNNNILATRAVTAGRVQTGHPAEETIALWPTTGIYKRPVSASNDRAKQVFILRDGDKFVAAIMAECGNPVEGKTPDIRVIKEISRDNQTFGENATFAPGEKAYFRITVGETTGNGILSGVTLSDPMPSGFSYVAGSTKINFEPAADISAGPLALGDIAPSAYKVVTFEATAHFYTTSCGVDEMVNTATADSDETNQVQDTASGRVQQDCVVPTPTPTPVPTPTPTPVPTPTPTPVPTPTPTPKPTPTPTPVPTPTPAPKRVRCVAITGPVAAKVGDTLTFNTSVSDPSLVASYTYSISGQPVTGQVTNRLTFVASAPGTYTVTADIVPVSGVAKDPSTCSTQFTVAQPVTPIYKCAAMNVSKTTVAPGETVQFSVQYLAQNGATLKDIVIDYGDGSKGSGSSVSYAYKQPGTYTAKATVNFTLQDGKVVSDSGVCEVTVTVKKDAPKPVAVCSDLMADKMAVKVGEAIQFVTSYKVLNGATYKRTVYNYGDGTTNELGTHAYTKADTYTVSTTLEFAMPDGTTFTVTDQNCTLTVKVVAEPKEPVYVCNQVTADKMAVKVGEKVTFSTSYTALNGATYKRTVYNYGDGTTADDKGVHAYTKAGEYEMTAVAEFTLTDGTVVSNSNTACKLKITVTDQPKPTPVTLPVTGAGALTSVFIATSLAGGVAYRTYAARRQG